jgi:DNA-binding response OmpR family regulator
MKDPNREEAVSPKSLVSARPSSVGSEYAIPDQVSVGDFTLKFGVAVVSFRGKPIPLSVKETLLLGFLLKRPGHYFSEKEIMSTVWPEMSPDVNTHTLVTHKYRLSQILKQLCVTGVVIRVQRSPKGYGIFFTT